MGSATQRWFKKVVNGAMDRGYKIMPSYMKRDTEQVMNVAGRMADNRRAIDDVGAGIYNQAKAGQDTRLLEGVQQAHRAFDSDRGRQVINAASYLTGDGSVARGIGRTATLGVGAGVAYRFGSGGSLTRNSEGESDIVGLPI